ncbi:MAG: nucleoside triphosphate pyrophosphohydrolase [Pseudomonadota bacterium]
MTSDRSPQAKPQPRAAEALALLLEIMRRLRAPDGCPWDQEQTFASIAPYTIEEAYEVADAIARADMGDLRDELGDLLLQVVYHARIAEEAGAFAFADVAQAVSDKMIRRHPHVFGDGERIPWEEIKAAERAAKAAERGAPPRPASVLDAAPAAAPALTRSVKLQAAAARVGFDWPSATRVLDKIVEEAAELAEAAEGDAEDAPAPSPETVEEYGDLLFVMSNLGRHLRLDPEAALAAANAKFSRRFRAIEAALAAQGRRPEDASLEEMEALWTAAKRRERDGGAVDADAAAS